MSVNLAKGDYTVGWICALSTELTAALAMLDEIHPSLPRSSSDTNTYVLGRIGAHNIVIACLPQGRAGISAVAITANLMKHKFSSIQFTLMVGIGGGVPSAMHDIRLGDVVVSTPGPQSGGVVQYDFGKTIAESRFVRTGVLSPPPTVLLTAISLLRARHEASGGQLSHHLSAVNTPNLQSKYTHQGSQHDQLFVAEYDHISDVDCKNCDESKLVMRAERGSLDPVVHYGAIASASQIMRHSGTRDRLGSELGVLCFEMEAAGLMNDFPCVVIRGFWGVFWIDASNDETAERGFLDIADICGFEKDLESTKKRLSNMKKRWLLIVDNADDPSVNISKYFPAGNRGTILVTTRNYKCESHQTVGSWESGRMELKDAVALLLKTTAVEDRVDNALLSSAENIVKDLSCLALAITQAGAFIREQHYSMEEYRDVYSHSRRVLLSRQPAQANSNYKYTVYTTWEVSMEKIAATSDQTARNAIEILKFFSFLHFDGISEQIFRKAWENIRESKPSEWMLSHLLGVLLQVKSAAWDPWLFREATSLLETYSLISVRREDGHNIFSMHPLVHTWSRDRLGKEQKKYWLTATLTLGMSVPRQFLSYDHKLQRSLLPHIDSCLKFHHGELFLDGDRENECLDVASEFARMYAECGQFKEAKSLDEKVLETRRRRSGEDHPATLKSMSILATTYKALHHFEESKELSEKLVQTRSRTLGENHPDTLRSMSHLAVIYNCLGRFKEAKEFGEKVVNLRIEALGALREDGQAIFCSMTTLADAYYSLGRLEEAKQFKEEVVKISTRTLGEDHPITLTAMHSLAIFCGCLGQLEQGRCLGERVVKAQMRVLGADHPHTLVSMLNLALTYGSLGCPEEAKQLAEEVVKARIKAFGEDHPDTLRSMSILEDTYCSLGLFKEARELGEKVVEANVRMLSNDHPNTLRSMFNLASTYHSLGLLEEAKQLKEKVVEARIRALGEDHPNTLESKSNLEETYRSLGLFKEAKRLREEVSEAQSRTSGQGHHPGSASNPEFHNNSKEPSPSERKRYKRPPDESQSADQPPHKRARPSFRRASAPAPSHSRKKRRPSRRPNKEQHENP
ncbi:hypothetical protein GP486_005513 [Trichoglossum hirsutum]|uniref:Nucleoside phosphorylase domain-containing protein n=1 Tax=Trichoglossum hirsutum TaxID=265104 RepID=A0A9P8L915_9PEZI|nr:hypothetical protein GP486_005513 [Trichoglossum hirsutum]